jgi:hypothetical protein
MAGPHTNRRKSPKIAPPAVAAVVWPRARRTHIVKNRWITEKKRRLRRSSKVQPDLRGSLIRLIVIPTVKSNETAYSGARSERLAAYLMHILKYHERSDIYSDMSAAPT